MRTGTIVLALGLALAVSVGGSSSAWAQEAVAVPTDVRATGNSKNRKVTVTWSDDAADANATYRVERALVVRLGDADDEGKAVEGEPFFDVLTTLAASIDPASGNPQRFVDKSAEPDAEYLYRVVKVDGDAESAPSVEDQAFTPGPKIKRVVNLFWAARQGWDGTVSAGDPAVEREVKIGFRAIDSDSPSTGEFEVTITVDGSIAFGGIATARDLSKRVARVQLVATQHASLLGRQFEDHDGLPVKARFQLPPPIHFIGQPLFDEFKLMHVRLKAAFNPANPLIGSFRRLDFDVNRGGGFVHLAFLSVGAGKKKATVGDVVAMVADVRLAGPGALLPRNDGSPRLALSVNVTNGRILEVIAARNRDSARTENSGGTAATLGVNHLTPFVARRDARARFVFLVEVLPAAAGGELRMEFDRIFPAEGILDADEGTWSILPTPTPRTLEVAVDR